MALNVCTSAITQGGERVKKGEVIDSSSDLVTRYASSFTSAVGIGTTADAASVKGMYMTGVIAVTVPAITDPDIAKVDVDISADPLTFVAAIGDAVIAIPQEALPTNARLQNAWVTATDSVQVLFGSEGGNVTSGAKNFKFLIFDLT